MGSSTGKLFKVTNFGESHGVALGCIIENCPAGMELTEADIQPDLDRRKPGQSKITTQRKEEDQVKIVSGTFENKTIGSPITMLVYNGDQRGKDYTYFKDIYRPSHADYTYQQKYGFRSYVGGGRSSARATIGTVAAGSVAKKILSLKTSMKFAAYVSQVKDIKISDLYPLPEIDKLQQACEENMIRCPDQETARKMIELIEQTSKEGDSVGGIITLVIENVPAGLGNPVYDRLDALLAYAMMAIPAVKGVEIGSGFSSAQYKGSEHNDIFFNDKGAIHTRTNRSGGIQGGISNGENIVMNIAFKPTATLSIEQPTVNEKGEEVMLKVRGRHDPCVLPRAVPIVEAAAALVMVDQYLLNKLADIRNI